MSYISRKQTRTILNSTETTNATSTTNTVTLAFNITETDSFYIGYPNKFSSRYFKMGVASTASRTVTVQYWDGAAWAAVDDLFDQTSAFTASGFISWENKDDWTKKNISPIDSDIELYWIKLTVSDDLSATTTLQAVLNLFCDDTLVKAYYPEIISDTRYLPTGATNFLDQYIAAKDLVVLRLKQRGLIDAEWQIIDTSHVAVAAVHAAAYIILAPIAGSVDMVKEMADRARDQFEKEVAQLTLGVDQNKDGSISDGEQVSLMTTFVRRR